MSIVNPVILSRGMPIKTSYQVVTIDVRKEVNRIPTAQIILLDGDVPKGKFPISDGEEFIPGTEIEIKLPTETQGELGVKPTVTDVFKGIVVRHRIESDKQHSRLILDLKDKAVKLTAARKSAVFREQSDSQIISTILTESGMERGKTESTFPEHQELVQYYCTDWDFILSRADANGLLVTLDDGKLSLHKTEVKPEVKAKFEFGIDEIYRIDLEVDVGAQHTTVESIGWDLKELKPTVASRAKEVSVEQGNLKGEVVAEKIGAKGATLKTLVPLHAKELQAWADGRMARSRLSMIRGSLSVFGFAKLGLLDVVKLEKMGERFNGDALVSGLRYRYDTQAWQTDVYVGLPATRFAEREGIEDVPAAGLLPAVSGLQIGMVTTYEKDPDNELRVKVILPGIHPSMEKGGVWARLAAPYAGENHGYVFRPEVGDEVVIGFFNADPRQAVILGAMHSFKNKPPEVLTPPDEQNTKKGIVTQKGIALRFMDKEEEPALIIETPKGNRITLDEAEKRIQIEDQHSNTITMNEDGIAIKTSKKLSIEAQNIDLKAEKEAGYEGESVKMKAAQQLGLEGQSINVKAELNVEIEGQKVDVK